MYELAQPILAEYELQFAEACALGTIPPVVRADVEERAAILEYDGRLTRSDANREALTDYVTRRRRR